MIIAGTIPVARTLPIAIPLRFPSKETSRPWSSEMVPFEVARRMII